MFIHIRINIYVDNPFPTSDVTISGGKYEAVSGAGTHSIHNGCQTPGVSGQDQI